jgi:16S rRNA (cytosine967-C5)-methyltransferase
LALAALEHVFERGRPVDEFLDGDEGVAALDPRDRAFLLALVQSVFRHKGEIEENLSAYLSKPLPRKSGAASLILLSSVAQLRYLAMAPHAVIDMAVRLAKADRNATHFSGLINAVLRKVATGPDAVKPGAGVATPEWLWGRWAKDYGPDVANAIATANASEAALDLTVKDDPAAWSAQLGGMVLPTGSVRIDHPKGPVTALPGFAEGAWWVQDAAAAIPARLVGDVTGLRVLDLCAAPGGKTLQLAAAGGRVTAVDQSVARLTRLHENLRRTGLTAAVVTADVLGFAPDELFDCVLLDAPCSATGTLRRHPDLLYLKSTAQIGALVQLQRRMLAQAVRLVKPGGTLVYCTCSLDSAEGEGQIARLLTDEPKVQVKAISPGEAGLPAHLITRQGFFRSLPHLPLGASAGLDGFFAARLTKTF